MPAYPFPSAPTFGTRVPFQFISTDMPSLSISIANNNTLTNNPLIFNVNAGINVSTNPGIDGLNYLRGPLEYAPFSLGLEWKQIGYNDYLSLAALQPYYIHLITHRLLGYYGRLALEGPKTAGPKTSDVLALQGLFYPMTPSDQGGAATITRLATPTSFTGSAQGAGTGYIPTSQTNYYWLTFATLYGQTLPQAIGPLSSSSNNTSNLISWTWPSGTARCTAAYIYASTSSSVSTAMELADVPVGLAPSWTDYVGAGGAIVNNQPPTVSTAYQGSWTGGIWTSGG